MDPLKIGHVIGVEGDAVEVQISVGDLRIEYHGTTYRVGRLGTYVTLPMDRNTLIGYVTRVGATGDLEPGPDPDQPRCVTMTVQLLGTVRNDKFTRGVNEYPTLGDPVRPRLSPHSSPRESKVVPGVRFRVPGGPGRQGP